RAAACTLTLWHHDSRGGFPQRDRWAGRRRRAMAITMIKKRLANGEPCRKCAQAEDLLRRRGLWERIDEVVVADEGDPQSPGMRLAAELGVANAPFFVVDGEGTRRVYTSVLALIGEVLAPRSDASASLVGS